MRAVLWILPVRSLRGSPACSPCWNWVLMQMQGINMVNLQPNSKKINSFTHSFILKTDCCGLVSKGKTPLLHALASSDGLTVHNVENIQLLLEKGTDCKTPLIFTLPSCLLLVIEIPPYAGSRLNHYIQKFVLVCTHVHLYAFWDQSKLSAFVRLKYSHTHFVTQLKMEQNQSCDPGMKRLTDKIFNCRKYVFYVLTV